MALLDVYRLHVWALVRRVTLLPEAAAATLQIGSKKTIELLMKLVDSVLLHGSCRRQWARAAADMWKSYAGGRADTVNASSSNGQRA